MLKLGHSISHERGGYRCCLYRQTNDGQIIFGRGLTAFIHNSSYQLETIKVYEDGLIGCWGLVDLDGFKQNVRQGQVVT